MNWTWHNTSRWQPSTGSPRLRAAGSRKAGEHPFRDDVWAGDLGRGTRTYVFAGDAVFAQRDAMVAAAERHGLGRVVEPGLAFVETGGTAPSFPRRTRTPAPLGQPGARWRRAGEDDAAGAMAADHGLAVANPLGAGLDAANAAVRTASGFARAVTGVVNGGARVVGAVNVPARSWGAPATAATSADAALALTTAAVNAARNVAAASASVVGIAAAL